MSGVYHDGSRYFQDRFDTRRMADRLEERIIKDYLDDNDKAFIARMEMFFLATADEFGFPNCSYKGGRSRLRPYRGRPDDCLPELRR